MILLTKEEMVDAYGIEGEFGTMERVCQAQLKKVGEWGGEDCQGHDEVGMQKGYARRKDCWGCWQALKKEAGG